MISDIILSNLVYVPAAFLCLSPMENQLRFSRRRTVLLACLALAVIIGLSCFLDYYFQLDENTLLLPALFIFFLLYYLSLRAHISKSLAVFCAVIALLSILSNFGTAFALLLVPSRDEATVSLFSSLFLLILSIAATAALAHPYRKYGSKIIDQTISLQPWQTMVLVSITIFAMNMLILPMTDELSEDNHFLVINFLLLQFALLMIWLLTQLVFYFIVTGMLTITKAEERNRILEMRSSQFDLQQRYMKESEKTRHDFRQNIRTLSELYNAGDFENLGKYLQGFNDSLPVKEVSTYTVNPSLNALLNFYDQVARSNGIDCTIQVNIPEILSVSDIDLCTMVGNILENAVMACEKAEEKFIRLSILAEDGVQLYIVVSNSFDGTVRLRNGRYFSTRRKGKGVGLTSVASTAESYGGVAQFSHEGTCFYSNIAIPLH